MGREYTYLLPYCTVLDFTVACAGPDPGGQSAELLSEPGYDSTQTASMMR